MSFNERGGAVISLVLGMMIVLTGLAMVMGMNHQRSARAQRGFIDMVTTRHLLSASLFEAVEQIESGEISSAGGYISMELISDNFVIGPATVAPDPAGNDWIVSVSARNTGQAGDGITVWHVTLDCNDGKCGVVNIVETCNVASTVLSIQEGN